jgi:hypothetical protein
MTPQLSVVVPSVNGISDLTDCLSALQQEHQRTPLEVIVVDRCGEAVRRVVRERFPFARLLAADGGTSIPDMRLMAFDAATAPSVAVIEDHVIVPPGWAAQLLQAQGGADVVVGGSVENAATSRLVDWAAFLCEYSHCIAPMPDGPAEGGRWENHLHDAMRRDGIQLVCRPEIRVGHKKHYTMAEYLSQRYLYARSYAGARMLGASIVRRLGYGVAAAALPPVLFYRTVRRVLSKKRHRRELVRSLPLLALFVTSWAAGEVVGSVAGPGDSLAKIC